jgi:hypothetical protein
MLLNGNNIKHELDGCIYKATIIPMGQYRVVPCFSTHKSSDETIYKTRYCPPADIEHDMNWSMEQIKALLSQAEGNMDPFRVFAWIQWASFHFFEKTRMQNTKCSATNSTSSSTITTCVSDRSSKGSGPQFDFFEQMLQDKTVTH